MEKPKLIGLAGIAARDPSASGQHSVLRTHEWKMPVREQVPKRSYYNQTLAFSANRLGEQYVHDCLLQGNSNVIVGLKFPAAQVGIEQVD